jgi:hypothetical protein
MAHSGKSSWQIQMRIAEHPGGTRMRNRRTGETENRGSGDKERGRQGDGVTRRNGGPDTDGEPGLAERRQPNNGTEEQGSMPKPDPEEDSPEGQGRRRRSLRIRLLPAIIAS